MADNSSDISYLKMELGGGGNCLGVFLVLRLVAGTVVIFVMVMKLQCR